MITIPVPLTSEEQAALLAQAEIQGVPVDAILREAVLHVISAGLENTPGPLNGPQWEKEFEEWLDSLPDMPTLSDEAMSRASIYTREDEWR